MATDTQQVLPTMLQGAVHKLMSAWAYRGKSKLLYFSTVLSSVL